MRRSISKKIQRPVDILSWSEDTDDTYPIACNPIEQGITTIGSAPDAKSLVPGNQGKALRHFSKAPCGALEFRYEGDRAHGVILRNIAADRAQVTLGGRRQYDDH